MNKLYQRISVIVYGMMLGIIGIACSSPSNGDTIELTRIVLPISDIASEPIRSIEPGSIVCGVTQSSSDPSNTFAIFRFVQGSMDAQIFSTGEKNQSGLAKLYGDNLVLSKKNNELSLISALDTEINREIHVPVSITENTGWSNYSLMDGNHLSLLIHEDNVVEIWSLLPVIAKTHSISKVRSIGSGFLDENLLCYLVITESSKVHVIQMQEEIITVKHSEEEAWIGTLPGLPSSFMFCKDFISFRESREAYKVVDDDGSITNLPCYNLVDKTITGRNRSPNELKRSPIILKEEGAKVPAEGIKQRLNLCLLTRKG